MARKVYSSRYALSSIVYCGECGEIYRRVHWNNRGCRSIVWRFNSRLEEKGSDCCSSTVNEETLQNAVVKAINEALCSKNTFLETLQVNIATVLNEVGDKATDEIDNKLVELQIELLSLASSKSDYDNLPAEIHRFWSIKQETQEYNAQRQTKRQRISEMTEFLDMQSGLITEYDDKLTRQLVEKITVFEDKLQVDFKSGVDIEVKI
jgi:site-specific DNA recombinase